MNQLLSAVKAYTPVLRINHMIPSLTTARSLAIEITPFDVHELQTTPKTSSELSKEDALKFLEQMTVIRKMETVVAKFYTQRAVRGFCHLYSGEEAIAVGLFSLMGPHDTIITSYRCHAWTYLMSGSVVDVLAELLGKKSGCSRGKGGSMHMYAKNFFGGNGIVGAHVPLGAGAALAHKYRNNGGISITLYGDGASNQGQCFESYNMASLLKLPCIFGVENNKYAMGTSIDRGSAMPQMYKKGNWVPGIRLDGMDILAVREAGRFCHEYMKSGKGPLVLEFLTYRYSGHSMSDPGTSYRSRDEVEDVRKNRDPLKLLKDKIVANNLATEEDFKQIDEKTKKVVDDAVEKTKADIEIPVEEVACDIYSSFKGSVRMTQPGSYMEHKNVGFKPMNL